MAGLCSKHIELRGTVGTSEIAETGLVAVLRAKPGARSRLERELRAVVEESRSEPGTVLYVLTVREDDPDEFYVLELFQGPAALTAHNASGALAALRAQADDLLDGGIRTVALRPLVGKELPGTT